MSDNENRHYNPELDPNSSKSPRDARWSWAVYYAMGTAPGVFVIGYNFGLFWGIIAGVCFLLFWLFSEFYKVKI